MNSQQKSSTPVESSIPEDNEELEGNMMQRENMLLKAKYFCRIGMVPKTITSKSHDNLAKMNTYFQEKTAQIEDQSPATTECTSNLSQMSIPECGTDQDFETATSLENDEDPEEWMKQNLMKKNLLLRVQMQSKMAMGNQTTEALTPADRCKVAATYQEELNQELQENVKEQACLDQQLTMESSYTNAEGDFSMNFLMRTNEQARSCYYDRLISMKILKMTPSKNSQSIIIFDWDDTLLCTSYLIPLGIKGVTPSIVSVFKPVDELASKLLCKAANHGQVFIITNAEQGWVEYSAQVFLPKTYCTIRKKNITIISARSSYQEAFPGDNQRWKKEAFTSLMKHFEKDIVTNLICIGDSNIEMDAAHYLAKQFDKAIIKTIKFKENPKPEELAKQQYLVLDKFETIFVSFRNTTIRLERK